jgi:hypothetical protein
MNTVSRTITGSLAMILGLGLILLGFFTIVTLFYGIPIFIIGIFILLNDKEDSIEKIKTKSKGGKK